MTSIDSKHANGAAMKPPTPFVLSTLKGVAFGLVLTVIVLALSPLRAETLAFFAQWGLDAGAATIAFAVIAIGANVLITIGGRLLQRRRHWAFGLPLMFAGLAWAYGILACTHLFAGMIMALPQPVSDAPPVEALVLPLLGLLGYGVFVFAGFSGFFDLDSARSLEMRGFDPDTLDLRRRDRQALRAAALAGMALGVACFSLAVAHIGASVVAATISCLSFAACAWIYFRMWRKSDELMRRIMVEGGAIAAFVLAIVTFLWSAFEAVSDAPPMTGGIAFALIVVVQNAAWFMISMRVMARRPVALERAS